MFQNGAWDNHIPDVVVFDDHFVVENVCSGMQVETGHRQKLHELIIGTQGVALSVTLQGHVECIEQHNRDIRDSADAIRADAHGGLSVDEFCKLENRDDIDEAIQEADRNLAAARQADAVRQYAHFRSISLPVIDLAEIEQVVGQQLPDLARVYRVRHVRI